MKPIILFYNFDKEKVHVSLKLQKGFWKFSKTYPLPDAQISNYEINWEIQLFKNKNFINNSIRKTNNDKDKNKKEYAYLFWEATILEKKNKGILVKKFNPKINDFYVFSAKNLLEKLDSLLTMKGLSAVERQDLITYWISHLTKKKFVFISFLQKQEIDLLAKLQVSPEQPQSIIRVYMLFKPVDEVEENLNLIVDDLNIFKKNDIVVDRDMFSGKLIVEWGAINLE